MDSVYSKRIRAGKRRTYFFDVRTTRGNDYYLTITESRKRFNDDGYDRHKIFLYKEDFNKLSEAVDHVKTELMPDFDFDAFNHEYDEEGNEGGDGNYGGGYNADAARSSEVKTSIVEDVKPESSSNDATPMDNGSDEQVDKW
jgi:hypothetical protein